MMSKRSQVIEIIRLVTLLTGGLSVPAYAQAPVFSPPSLPAIPGAPSAPSAPAATTIAPARTIPEVDAPSTPALPDLSSITPGATTAKTDTIKQPTSGAALSDLPAPVSPESGDKVATDAPAATPATATATPAETKSTDTASAIPPLPAATTPAATIPDSAVPALLPPPGSTDTAASAPPAFSLALPPVATSEPEMPAEKPAALKRKSWETTLAPTSTAYNAKFNYRRQLLPDTIYRTQYDRENDHLPTRITRADYDHLLLQSAAANDINATRALLNAGANPNITNRNGETPLALARRYGAMDTASLLAARGAQ